MKKKLLTQIVVILSLLAIVVYLVVEAPVPLHDMNKNSLSSKVYSIQEVFKIIAAENANARAFYTKSIVGVGKNKNLFYDENWKETGVDAGPLPALFLRETAKELEKTGSSLGLYLGSVYPISQANLLKGVQAEVFKKLIIDKKPKFFYDSTTQRYMGMFVDIAKAEACVNCHNQHPKSPKKDWKLNDIMGATTWSFTKDSVTSQEMLHLVKTIRKSIANSYSHYLEKSQKFKVPPKIVPYFDNDQYDIPSLAAFVDTLSKISSNSTINNLLK